jgi:hypothetical protein
MTPDDRASEEHRVEDDEMERTQIGDIYTDRDWAAAGEQGTK